jgi:predicted cupin superfamily sugar epimerase
LRKKQMKAEELKKWLNLAPLRGEGGYFAVTYRTPEGVPQAALPPRYNGDRSFGTAIYYMLTPDEFSALHRLKSHEIYHFYLGDAVTLLLLYPGGESEVITLGHGIEAGQRVQVVVPQGTWQGSFLQPGGAFALMGTTMAPGFDPADFELGSRESLMRTYPDRQLLIERLTPP